MKELSGSVDFSGEVLPALLLCSVFPVLQETLEKTTQRSPSHFATAILSVYFFRVKKGFLPLIPSPFSRICMAYENQGTETQGLSVKIL